MAAPTATNHTSPPASWTIEMMMPASASPPPPTVPLDRLTSLWPRIEKIRPSSPQKNDRTNPAIAMPDVRVTTGAPYIPGMLIGGRGMPCPGATPGGTIRLVAHCEQNAALGRFCAPQVGQFITHPRPFILTARCPEINLQRTSPGSLAQTITGS